MLPPLCPSHTTARDAPGAGESATRYSRPQEKTRVGLTSTITDADLTQLLKILLPQAEATGRASATLKLSGNLMSENDQGEEALSLRGLTGTASISTLTINVAELSLSTAGPLLIDFKPGELNVHETKFTGTETNVTLGGTIATAAGGINTLAINGQINLRILGLFSKDVFSSGFARLDVNLGGTYEKPRLTGRASVNGGSVSVLLGDQRITLANLDAALVFNSTQAQIERLKARLGAGEITDRKPQGLEPAAAAELGPSVAARQSPSMVMFRPRAGAQARALKLTVARYTQRALQAKLIVDAKREDRRGRRPRAEA